MTDSKETKEKGPRKALVKGEVVLRDHEYDGIQEYDQHLPNWWLFSFYIFVVAFVIYWVAFDQLGAVPTPAETLEGRLAVIEEAHEKVLLAMLNDDGLWEMSRNEATVAKGREIYNSRCMACHGMELGGRNEGPQFVGEPLNDAEWKYGANPVSVFNVVNNGSPDVTKGMPPWGPMLGPGRVGEVVAFVLSYHQPPPPGAESQAPAAEGGAPPSAN